MNFPTAQRHAENDGAVIGRTSWLTDGVSSQWITYEYGAWYLHTSSGRDIVKSGDLTEADFRATDWEFPAGCALVAGSRPSIQGDNQSSLPTFNIAQPPCAIN